MPCPYHRFERPPPRSPPPEPPRANPGLPAPHLDRREREERGDPRGISAFSALSAAKRVACAILRSMPPGDPAGSHTAGGEVGKVDEPAGDLFVLALTDDLFLIPRLEDTVRKLGGRARTKRSPAAPAVDA